MATKDSSLSQHAAIAKLHEKALADLLSQWEQTGVEVRTGVACKCGAHCSVPREKGGREWLTEHVLSAHVKVCPHCGMVLE